MIKGLYTGALSMIAQMNKMDVVTNNIANVDTTGFKKDTVITQSFEDALTRRINEEETFIGSSKKVGNLSLGVYVQNVFTDFKAGSLVKVDDPLALSINGDGFFCINYKDHNGNLTEMYSRDGGFSLSANRKLITKDGYSVLTDRGEITLPDGEITIDDNGNIFSSGNYIAKLKLVDIENKNSLSKFGKNLYNKIDETIISPFKSKILQGFLESSNVNSVVEMVEMINLSRAFEINQRTITIHDQSLGKAVNDIAKK